MHAELYLIPSETVLSCFGTTPHRLSDIVPLLLATELPKDGVELDMAKDDSTGGIMASHRKTGLEGERKKKGLT